MNRVLFVIYACSYGENDFGDHPRVSVSFGFSLYKGIEMCYTVGIRYPSKKI